MTIKRKKVILLLDRKPIPTKIVFARNVVTDMTGNPNFGAGTPINPPLADVTTATDELEVAYIDAQNGGTEQTAIMYEKEFALDNLLIPLGHYVEDVANQTPEMAESIILSAGMEVKSSAAPPGIPDMPENLNADYGEKEGEIKLDCDPVKGARCYVWLFSTTPDGSTPFKMKRDFASITTKSEYTWEDLDPGAPYSFKVFAVGAGGHSAISDVVIHRAA